MLLYIYPMPLNKGDTIYFPASKERFACIGDGYYQLKYRDNFIINSEDGSDISPQILEPVLMRDWKKHETVHKCNYKKAKLELDVALEKLREKNEIINKLKDALLVYANDSDVGGHARKVLGSII